MLKRSGIKKEQAELISDAAGLKGCAAYDFVTKYKDKIGEISEVQQLSLFEITYNELKRDVERICKDRATIKNFIRKNILMRMRLGRIYQKKSKQYW